MGPEEVQAIIDANEADAATRYERQQQFAGLIGEAVKVADAHARLEAALRYQPQTRRSVGTSGLGL